MCSLIVFYLNDITDHRKSGIASLLKINTKLINTLTNIKLYFSLEKNVASEQCLAHAPVRSVWVGEKGCRNSWRKESESNKERYLSHETTKMLSERLQEKISGHKYILVIKCFNIYSPQ